MHTVMPFRSLCSCLVLSFWFLSAFPAALAASDPVATVTSAADSIGSIVAGVISQSASFPPLSAFPGDRLSFANISYNRVDGLFLGIGSDKRQALRLLDTSLLAHISLGYSFGSHYWQATAGLARRFGARDGATIVGGEYYYYTDSHDGWKIPTWENSLHAFFAREDYLSWFRRVGFSLYAEQFFSRDVSAIMQFAADRYEPLERTVSWSLFGGDKTFSENPSFGRADIRALTLAFRYNGMPKLPRAGSGIRVAVQGEKAWNGLSYERWLAEAVWHCPIAPIGAINSRVRCGSLTGNSFAPKVFTIGGTGSLLGFALHEYEGNRMMVWNTELLLYGTALTSSRIGASMSVILSCDIGYTAFVPESEALWQSLLPGKIGQMKSGVGIAIGSANGRLRVGAAWRTDRKESPSIVVRFSPSIEVAK